MIYLTFRLENPWAKSCERQQDFFCKYWKLSKNKGLEIQLTWFDWQTLLGLHVSTHWRGQDHAGPRVELTIAGLMLNIEMQDNRHWGHERNKWCTHEEEN